MNIETSLLPAEQGMRHQADEAGQNFVEKIRTWISVRRWFVLLVIVPTLIAAFYYAFLAPAVFVSESSFVIQSPGDKKPKLTGLAGLVGSQGLSGGQEQARETLEYVQSRDALRELQKDMDVRAKLESPGLRVQNLIHGDTFERLYMRFGDMVSARLDTESGLSLLKVKAYSAKDAYEINAKLLDLSENLVNKLNTRARDRAIAEAQHQVDIATQRAKDARVAMAQFRNSKALLDPQVQGEGALSIANSLIAQRATSQAQLATIERLTPHNPSIPALRDRIQALSAQIAAQGSEVAGAPNGLASKMEGYEKLFVEQEFATENLTAANAALVQAKADAQQKQYYLERIVEPNTPDEALLPHRFLDVLIVFAALTSLYFIGWMLIVGILEHAPED